jgi:GntR family transcriptional regulator, rspAB operon transcriptional repressor
MKTPSSLAELLGNATIDRVTPLRDQIYHIIRGAIVTQRLKPGDSIDEAEIARHLGISRTPVREAVKKISDEHLIEVRAQSGTYVAPISRGQVEEAYIIRTALELESVARAAPLITPAQITDLEDIVRGHARAFERKLFAEAVISDDRFHRYIAEVNGLSMLWRAVDISKAQMDRCRHLAAVAGPAYGHRTIAQHRAIIRALASGMRDAAVIAMREHLDASLANALKLLKSTPEQTRAAEARRQRDSVHGGRRQSTEPP